MVFGEVMEMQTQPRPLGDLFDHPRADKLAEDVAKDREQMAVLLNGESL
jgi:hypothetical protein